MKKYILFFAFSLLVTGLTSCDDGRIYENTGFVPREGRVLKLSGKFSGINKWSEGYSIVVAGFDDERLSVPSLILTAQDFADGKALEILHQYHIDFIVLAGFLLKVPDAILHDYPNKIVNIHPALLPKFGGKGMYGSRVHQAVIASHEKESGITIHYINERYDEGNTIFQATCPVLPTDTPDTLAIRVHQLEYEYFPRVIEATILGKNLSI